MSEQADAVEVGASVLSVRTPDGGHFTAVPLRGGGYRIESSEVPGPLLNVNASTAAPLARLLERIAADGDSWPQR